MEKIKVLALGGLDEEGKDLYCIEINDDIFVINCGYKHPTRFTPGIDFIISDFSYLKENKNRIVAYIIPKNKRKHFGALPYIYKDCPAPIYCTDLTKIFFLKFASDYKQENNFDIHTLLLPTRINIHGHNVDFFSTCSSVPSSFGFSISTEYGNIVFSGDFIVEYNNTKDFYFDLNTIGKISEKPTLLLMCDSTNANKTGYCSPNNRLTPHLEKYFKQAPGRIFIAFSHDNFYHLHEILKVCNAFNKKIAFYDDVTKNAYDLSNNLYEANKLFPKANIINTEDILRIKENSLVILICDTKEKLYEKVSLLANNEHESKLIRLMPNDTFIMACTPNDNNEVIFTSTIDDLYRSGSRVEYLTTKSLVAMHAYEEDIRMLLSLLKPKYYFPIEGYYVNLLANAMIAFDMNLNLSHNNIFLLDNGQTLEIEDGTAKVDFNNDGHIKIGDVMIDGIGVGDVVNEIINDRTRLSDDGVIILGCGVSLKEKKITYGPDVQMRGFLFLKDKDADVILKEVTKLFVEATNKYLLESKPFVVESVQNKINDIISKYLLKQSNRNPVIKSNIIVID